VGNKTPVNPLQRLHELAIRTLYSELLAAQALDGFAAEIARFKTGHEPASDAKFVLVSIERGYFGSNLNATPFMQ
jgi:hypothetical protein